MALLLALCLTTLALAHAELIGAEPAIDSVVPTAPTQVRLYFSEPIEPDFFSLQVYASDRSRVDRGDARIAPDDARVLQVSLREIGVGTYTVVWRAVSLDSHIIQGVHAFTVGSGIAPQRPLDMSATPYGAPFPVEAAARWLTYLLMFVLMGGFAFRVIVLAPTVRALGSTASRIDSVLMRRWLWFAWPVLAVLVIATISSLFFQASSAAGIPLSDVFTGNSVSRVLLATRFGAFWIARVIFLIGLIALFTWVTVAGSTSRTLALLGAAVVAGAMLTVSGAGHAAAVPDLAVLAIVSDWVHLLAGGIWVGGLLMLGLVLPKADAGLDDDVTALVEPARAALLGRRDCLGGGTERDRVSRERASRPEPGCAA